ncbi:MAG: crossover junction endodeoxyribonuclease RuvC [Candidatus Lloydbacteria bacterium CG22_combo_CG10-13_8_21_14_all_47_15]|uniref:Crossover junction endodeoxyribonuclease RuvC n=1 Tax=Candidatus Lloydbacteria bacterium CG22_combo_CG10-13_8_21_14_all_47_15 TaxID=1974635 RepID=A0A2H0CVN8_9BACT|nr:MAG: crossover junction endodeoxyribonuclease RuvC [Candidatus Lloydbacteria bacterium CG22_combo_CG10-13_8_21_14_all_47_15]
MKTLGIDPGFGRVGVSVISGTRDTPVLEYSACIITGASLPFHKRLADVGHEIERLISLYTPDSLAIETLFFSTNKKTAMRVAEARGMIIYIAAKNNLEVFEYSPADIKIALTGYGKADKEQVTAMVKKIFSIEKKTTDDEYDAVATGLTHTVSSTKNRKS